jgi:hypothetical protein
MLSMQDGDKRSSARGTGESTSWAHAACRSSIYGHYQCTSSTLSNAVEINEFDGEIERTDVHGPLLLASRKWNAERAKDPRVLYFGT